MKILSGNIRRLAIMLAACVALPCCDNGADAIDYRSQVPVSIHGALRIQGSQFLDRNNQVVSFAGVSLFWGNAGWGGEKYYNAQVVNFLRRHWGTPLVRIAMGVETPGGYLEDPRGRLAKVIEVADAAAAAGMYFVVDWHSHAAESHTQAAVEFFQTLAKRYGHTPNILYEIYNEPTKDSDWARHIKPYSLTIIEAIRAIDRDNIIIAGTPNWSQDVLAAAEDPILGHQNIAYALHFYAGSHREETRNNAQLAIDKGLPLVVTEWGAVDAYVKKEIAYGETKKWLEFLQKNQLTHCQWSLHDKMETSSFLQQGSPADASWNDSHLTSMGRLAKSIIANWPDLPAMFRWP